MQPDRQMKGQMNKQTERQIDRQTDEWTDKHTDTDNQAGMQTDMEVYVATRMQTTETYQQSTSQTILIPLSLASKQILKQDCMISQTLSFVISLPIGVSSSVLRTYTHQAGKP